MTTEHTLTGNILDLIGSADPSRVTLATVDTNLETALVDYDNNEVRLAGPKQLSIATDGTFSIDLIATDSTGTNVLDDSLRYVVRVLYKDATGRERSWDTGYFELTADADLSDKAGSGVSIPVDPAPSPSLIDAPTAANINNPASQTRGALDDRYGTVLRPKQFGAVGDKVTDDTQALRDTITAFRAHAVTDPPLSRPIVIDGEGGTYKITDSLDLTAIVLGRGWEIRNMHIVAACAGDIALDFTGSRFGRLSNVHVWGDQTNQPHTGIVLSSGASQATNPCSNFLFDNVSTDGYLTSSGLHMNAAEENAFTGCVFRNRRVADGSGESWAAILDGAGYKTVPSAFHDVNATRSSFTVNKFDRCAFQKPFGIAGPAVFMQDMASVSFESCYLTAGSGSGIEWRLTNGFTPYRVSMDFQIETTGIDRFIKFTSDAAGATREIRGLQCTFGNVYCDQEMFLVDPAITTLVLRGFKSHLFRMATGVTLANKLFNPATVVSIRDADIIVPASTDINTNFALLSGNVVAMDGTDAGPAWNGYVPTLTNWALSNGTISAAYRLTPNKKVMARIRYTVGSADTVSGNFQISLPVAAKSGTTGTPRGTAMVQAADGTTRKHRFAIHATSSTIQLADADDVRVAAATPFAFTTGAVIDITLSYEAA